MNNSQDFNPPEPNSTPSPEPRRVPQHPEFDPVPGPSRQIPRVPGFEDPVPDPGESTGARVDLSGAAEIPNEPSAPQNIGRLMLNCPLISIVLFQEDHLNPKLVNLPKH